MEFTPQESGFEELTRLSQKISNMGQEIDKKEQEREKKAVEKKKVVQGLKEIKVSVALEQLKPVATPEIIEEVSSLRHKRGSGDLRELILDLATELEKGIDDIAGPNPNIARSVKTLVILIELLFSIE